MAAARGKGPVVDRTGKASSSTSTFDCSVCMWSTTPEELLSHPFIDVAVCGTCHSFLCSTTFGEGDDGNDDVCKWSGQASDELYCCEYCSACICRELIQRHLGDKGAEQLFNKKKFKCFVCDSSPLRVLKKQLNTIQSIQKGRDLFHRGKHPIPIGLSPLKRGPRGTGSGASTSGNGSRQLPVPPAPVEAGAAVLVEWFDDLYVKGQIAEADEERYLVQYLRYKGRQPLPEYFVKEDPRIHFLRGDGKGNVDHATGIGLRLASQEAKSAKNVQRAMETLPLKVYELHGKPKGAIPKQASTKPSNCPRVKPRSWDDGGENINLGKLIDPHKPGEPGVKSEVESEVEVEAKKEPITTAEICIREYFGYTSKKLKVNEARELSTSTSPNRSAQTDDSGVDVQGSRNRNGDGVIGEFTNSEDEQREPLKPLIPFLKPRATKLEAP